MTEKINKQNISVLVYQIKTKISLSHVLMYFIFIKKCVFVPMLRYAYVDSLWQAQKMVTIENYCFSNSENVFMF